MRGPAHPRRSLRRRLPLLQDRKAAIAVPVVGPAAPFRVYESLLDAWQRHDAAAIAAHFAPEGRFRAPGHAASFQGAAIAAHAQALFDALRGFHLEVTQVDAVGDCVVDQWVASGCWSAAFRSGPLAGLAPTGRAFALQGIGVIEVEGGAVRSASHYWDQTLFLRQIGAPVDG